MPTFLNPNPRRSGGRIVPCLAPKTKPERVPAKHRAYVLGQATSINQRGLEKIATFISRAANYTPAKFRRKRRNGQGQVISVAMV